MPNSYQYIRVKQCYFCIQQNPLVFIWSSCFSQNSRLLKSLGIGKSTIIRAFKWMLMLRARPRVAKEMIELPVFGAVCISVHRGHKVFDIQNNVVTKILSQQADLRSVEQEIRAVAQASRLEFSPGMVSQGADDRWYAEDYIRGEHAQLEASLDSAKLMSFYQEHVEGCIVKMAMLRTPVVLPVEQHVQNLLSSLESSELRKQDARDKVATIVAFVLNMATRLREFQSEHVVLVFSHGDFAIPNMLLAREGLRVIDWESASYRSMLHDLHNFFLAELYFNRAATPLVGELRDASDSLLSKLQQLPTVVIPDAEYLEIYRRIYFLERIVTLAQRDLNRRQLNMLLRSVSLFQHYDETAGIGRVQL